MTEHNYLDNLEESKRFMDSPRGRYIVAQALYLGIKALYLYPAPYNEVSNAMDMGDILDGVYSGMREMFEQTQPPLMPPDWMLEESKVTTGGKPVTPTSKAPAIDLLLSEMAGKSREITLAENKCMTCKGDAIEFKDALSFKEYQISGMCQVCQDGVFN